MRLADFKTFIVPFQEYFGGKTLYRGATSQDADEWNARLVDVDATPARLWDWRDPQFLRGVRL